jgi:hypothetical protein
VKGLDLGELMKDVGLDLEGFDDIGSSGQLLSNIQIDPSQEDRNAQQVLMSSQGGYETITSGQTGSQLVAQIQQPLPLQVNDDKFRLSAFSYFCHRLF